MHPENDLRAVRSDEPRNHAAKVADEILTDFDTRHPDLRAVVMIAGTGQMDSGNSGMCVAGWNSDMEAMGFMFTALRAIAQANGSDIRIVDAEPEEAGVLGLYHHARGWLLRSDHGPLFGYDVREVRVFASGDAAREYLSEHRLMHPELPHSLERAGFTTLRVR